MVVKLQAKFRGKLAIKKMATDGEILKLKLEQKKLKIKSSPE
jgi:hypothetical protein